MHFDHHLGADCPRQLPHDVQLLEEPVAGLQRAVVLDNARRQPQTQVPLVGPVDHPVHLPLEGDLTGIDVVHEPSHDGDRVEHDRRAGRHGDDSEHPLAVGLRQVREVHCGHHQRRVVHRQQVHRHGGWRPPVVVPLPLEEFVVPLVFLDAHPAAEQEEPTRKPVHEEHHGEQVLPDRESRRLDVEHELEAVHDPVEAGEAQHAQQSQEPGEAQHLVEAQPGVRIGGEAVQHQLLVVEDHVERDAGYDVEEHPASYVVVGDHDGVHDHHALVRVPRKEVYHYVQEKQAVHEAVDQVGEPLITGVERHAEWHGYRVVYDEHGHEEVPHPPEPRERVEDEAVIVQVVQLVQAAVFVALYAPV
mmetsp:Transcript_68789/g.217546  ORF Transcript_68789/g.217546 Transcript_68789/m.217546 type:complete len:360 (+) Transcript_68789:455-1534(+)